MWLTYALPVPRIPRGKNFSNSAQLTSLSTPTGKHPAILGQQHQVVVAGAYLYHRDVTQHLSWNFLKAAFIC